MGRLSGSIESVGDASKKVDADFSRMSSGLGDLDKSSRGASGGLSELAAGIKDVRTVSATVAGIPALVAAVGAVPGVATAAGGALGQLGLALGQGLAGAAVIGGTAVYGAIGGLKAYTAAISSTVTASREAWIETNEKAAEALEKERIRILTASQASKDFNAEINDSVINLTKLQAAIGNQVFPAFTRELDYWNEYIVEFTPEIAKTAGELGKMAASFSAFVRSAQEGQLLRDIFDFVNGSAVRAADTLAALGVSGLLVFQKLIPPAVRLQKQVQALAQGISAWVQSVEGAARIDGILAVLERRFYQLVNVARDFGLGIVGVFQALNAQGGPERLMRGLESLAASFREVMAEGGRGRQAIVEFMNAAQPTLDQLWKLAQEAARQFGILASNVVRAGQSGGRMGTLASVIKSVRDSLVPLRGLLEDTFVALGPVLARLIPELARFAQTFLGSSGPLLGFLDSIERILSAFNRLPAPVRNAIASFVALKAILSALGITGAVTGLASLSVNLAQTSAIAAKSGSRFASLSAALTRLRTIAATTAAFLLGPWGIAIAAVAAAGFAIFKNWERIGPALKPAVEGFRALVNFARPFAQALGGAVVGALRAFASGLLAAIVPGKNFGEQITNLATAAGNFARRAIPVVVQALKGLTSGVEAATPFLRSLGEVVGRLLVKYFEWGVAAVKAVIAVLKALHDPVQTVANAFKALEPVVKTVVTAIGNAIDNLKNAIVAWVRSLVGAVVNFWKNQIWQPIANFLVEKANGMVQTLTNWKNKAVGWVRSLVGAILNFWKGQVWQPIANFLVEKSTGMSTTLTNWKDRAVSWVKSLPRAIGSLWNKLWQGMADFLVEKKDGMLNTVSNLARGIESGFNAIIGFINRVLSAVGLPAINIGGGSDSGGSNGPTSPQSAGGTGPAMRGAKGGVFHPSGRTEGLIPMAGGGVIAQQAVGGMADGNLPRAVYGEVGKREYYIVPDRPDNHRYLAQAANEMGYGLLPKRLMPHSTREHYTEGEKHLQRMAAGGILEAWRRLGVPMHSYGVTPSNVTPWMWDVNAGVERNFPVQGTTYAGHGAQGNARTSTDWLVADAWNTVATGADLQRGYDIVRYLGDTWASVLQYVIWNKQANYSGKGGGGWQRYTGGGGYAVPSNPSGYHEDHVHASVTPDGRPGGYNGSAGPNGGGPLSSLWDTVGEAIWNRLVQPAVNALSGRLGGEGNGVFGDIAGALVTNTAGKIKDYIIGAAGGSGGLPGGPSPGGLTLADAIAQGGWPANIRNTAVGVAWEESSARADAVNGQYRGLFQMGEAAAQEVGADYGRLFDPVYNSTAAADYYQKAGGWWPWEAYPPSGQSMDMGSQRVTGYVRGGIIPGSRGEPVLIQAHAGERVLSEEMTRSFDKLAGSIERWSSLTSGATARRPGIAAGPSGAAGVNVMRHADGGVSVGVNIQGVEELRHEVAALRADVVRQTRVIDTIPERTGGAVKRGTDHNLSRDTATTRAVAEGQRRRGVMSGMTGG